MAFFNTLSAPASVGKRFRAVCVFALAFVLALLPLRSGISPSARAQGPGVNGIFYSNQANFRIPFVIEAGAARLQEVQLYVSENQGQSWTYVSNTGQEQRGFDYRADRDGLYWFTVRTIDMQGRAAPLTLQNTAPQLKVYVDTRKPIITLRARSANAGQVAVEWDIREENLDPANFYLDYRVQGARDWIPLTADPVLAGDRAWSPGTNAPVEVRLRARDLARNESVALTVLTPGGSDFRPSSNSFDAENRQPAGAVPGRLYVNDRRISLNYKLKEQGPSGISLVELWQTKDGRTWEQVDKDPAGKPPFVYTVPGEGLYGFTLLPRSGVGLADHPPRSGDQPQVWVEVDLTPPVVHVVKVDVGRGQDSGKLTIMWKATDKGDNLSAEPISLSYAKQEDGEWKPIAANVPNSGYYVWTMPQDVPYKFFVRVEAVDRAGNTNSNKTVEAVIVDLALPHSEILGVTPATKLPPGGR
jgi:hypothetical protein